MANVKITDLSAYTNPAATDVLPIVDVAADVTKKVSIQDLLENAGSGTAALPGIAFDGDSNTGIYRPGADQLALSAGGVEALRIDSSGNLIIGDSSGTARLNVVDGSLSNTDINSDITLLRLTDRNSRYNGVETFLGNFQSGIRFDAVQFNGTRRYGSFIKQVVTSNNFSGGTQKMRTDLIFGTRGDNESSPSDDPVERLRIDSFGRLLVGALSRRSNLGVSTSLASPQLQIEGTGFSNSSVSIIRNTVSTGASPARIFLGKSNGASLGSNVIVADDDLLGQIVFNGNDGTNFIETASIGVEVDGTPGANDMPGRLVFSVTADGSASASEAMRINNAGELLVGYTSDNGAYKLQVNSQIFATSATIATSDGRYKENVAALDGCVDLVKALRPVSFDWKAQEPVTRVDEDGETVVVREAHNFPDGKQVGFIAQEVEEVLADKPWLGSVIKQNVRPSVTDADGNELAPEEEFLGIAEGSLVAVLTSALKDAIGRIESLEAEVAALKA